MILFEHEYDEIYKKFNEFDSRYKPFVPDVWWSEADGCFCTAIQDMNRSFEDGEIIEVFILMKEDIRFMWE